MKILPVLMVGLLIVSVMLMGSVTSAERVKAIVVFKDKVQDSDVKALVEQGGIVDKKLDIINGVSVELPRQVFDKIDHAAKHGAESKVKFIEIDQEVHILKVDPSKVKPTATPTATPTPALQVTPWGIQAVNADDVSIDGSGVKVAVVDTGIDYTHPDLAGKVIGGCSFVRYTKSYKDDNGHGTHVAGTIAAVNNNIGVVGVAPGASLLAVKVLDRSGSGYLSNVISGIQWSVTNGAQVISMSLGSSSDSQALHDAVDAANAGSVVVVVAAGNDGGAVSYPAAYDSVIAVSAVDESLTKASWSNFGTEVDLAAPGVNVYSTYKGSYAYLSGTSMACPHVSGVVALVLTTAPGKYDKTGDGWDPGEVKQKLYDTARDLGSTGKDNYYGYGLVDALKAVS
ncbi:S8 family peptidase [Methanocella paludicola]|nr:S8 family peptidase [Methanocella paludicola]